MHYYITLDKSDMSISNFFKQRILMLFICRAKLKNQYFRHSNWVKLKTYDAFFNGAR